MIYTIFFFNFSFIYEQKDRIWLYKFLNDNRWKCIQIIMWYVLVDNNAITRSKRRMSKQFKQIIRINIC